MQLTIETVGEAAVSRQLRGLGERLTNSTPVWGPVTAELRRLTARQFATEGQSGSAGWASLSPVTIARKQALGQPNRILEATGRLMRSVTTAQAQDGVDRRTNDTLQWGTTVPYAAFHQAGTSNMPRRPVVQLPESSRERIAREIANYFLDRQYTPGGAL